MPRYYDDGHTINTLDSWRARGESVGDASVTILPACSIAQKLESHALWNIRFD